MHINYPISIIEDNGFVHIIDEQEAERLARDIYYGKIVLRERHIDTIVDYDGYVSTVTSRYIARDDHGQIITKKTWPFKPTFPHWGTPRKEVLRAQELGLPIPNTSCYRGGPYKSRDKRVGEVRKQEGHDQQMTGIIVSGRSKPIKRKRPAPDWDSPRRRVQRCWKSQRKTRWK